MGLPANRCQATHRLHSLQPGRQLGRHRRQARLDDGHAPIASARKRQVHTPHGSLQRRGLLILPMGCRPFRLHHSNGAQACQAGRHHGGCLRLGLRTQRETISRSHRCLCLPRHSSHLLSRPRLCQHSCYATTLVKCCGGVWPLCCVFVLFNYVSLYCCIIVVCVLFNYVSLCRFWSLLNFHIILH